jgi:hypothetical protein
MYGGNAKSVYVTSLSNLTTKLALAGHTISQINLTNESLITRARNTLAHSFMLSDFDALLFIDGDHSFDADDIIKMVESGKDLIGAIYPMKSINWSAIKNAVLLGKENLEQYSGIFAVNMLDESQTFNPNEPFKVLDVGTGMMFITRKVFEEVKPLCKTYKSNSIGSFIPFGDEVIEYFTTTITEKGLLLSEDYAFCAMWRSLGNDVWAAPWVKITHAGEYNFSGYFSKTVELQMEVQARSQINKEEEVG